MLHSRLPSLPPNCLANVLYVVDCKYETKGCREMEIHDSQVCTRAYNVHACVRLFAALFNCHFSFPFSREKTARAPMCPGAIGAHETRGAHSLISFLRLRELRWRGLNERVEQHRKQQRDEPVKSREALPPSSTSRSRYFIYFRDAPTD